MAQHPNIAIVDFRPRDPRQPLRRTYKPFIHPTDNYTYGHSSQPVTAQTQVLETVQHPYGIGLSKPVIRIPVAAPVMTDEHLKHPVRSSVTKSSDINFNCHCDGSYRFPRSLIYPYHILL